MQIRFERSLRLDHARDGDALLAYAMNGEPLPIQHGYPAAAHRSALVRSGVGQVADRDRADRSAVRRSLPDRQVLVRVGAWRSRSFASR